MAYEAYCAACTYLGDRSDYSGKYWCSQKGEDRYACDAKCYNFCEAYSRSNSSRENMYENSAGHSSSGGCYLTSIICKILGFDDNNRYLNTLRNFRDNIMLKDEKYKPMLITYDVIGPTISRELEKDPHKKDIAEAFLANYIGTSVAAIKNGNYDKAIKIYEAMTNALADHYEIKRFVIRPNDNSYVINSDSWGHGKVRKMVFNKKIEA